MFSSYSLMGRTIAFTISAIEYFETTLTQCS